MNEPRTTTPTYTPGPWQVNPRMEGHVFAGDVLIAGCMGHSRNFDDNGLREQQIANARLVAAAPDLYEALKAIEADPHGCPMCDSGKLRNPDKEHWDRCGYPKLAAALAKAEGRS